MKIINAIREEMRHPDYPSLMDWICAASVIVALSAITSLLPAV